MGKTLQTSEIVAEFDDQVRNLRDLSEQVSLLERQISKITNKLDKYDRDLDTIGFNQAEGSSSNIIPFPGSGLSFHSSESERYLAMPGKSLAVEIPDFRPLLQRDGLILLAWDKRITEAGERFTAYWVTSTGIPRFYASRLLNSEDFPSACPDHKSYAAEDGIEFYGQKAPVYLVHVAPELMKSNPRHRELRPAHIRTLKDQGSKSDFNYNYLLTKERKRDPPSGKLKSHSPRSAGA